MGVGEEGRGGEGRGGRGGEGRGREGEEEGKGEERYTTAATVCYKWWVCTWHTYVWTNQLTTHYNVLHVHNCSAYEYTLNPIRP